MPLPDGLVKKRGLGRRQHCLATKEGRKPLFQQIIDQLLASKNQIPPSATDVDAVVDFRDIEQLDDLKLNLVWQLGPGALGNTAEDIKSALQALKGGLEVSELITGKTFNDTKNNFLPNV